MSRYPEIVKPSDATSNIVIKHMKSFFSRHGIPEEVRSDNGPQYSSAAFANSQANTNLRILLAVRYTLRVMERLSGCAEL